MGAVLVSSRQQLGVDQNTGQGVVDFVGHPAAIRPTDAIFSACTSWWWVASSSWCTFKISRRSEKMPTLPPPPDPAPG